LLFLCLNHIFINKEGNQEKKKMAAKRHKRAQKKVMAGFIFWTGWTGMSECSSAHGCALAAAD